MSKENNNTTTTTTNTAGQAPNAGPAIMAAAAAAENAAAVRAAQENVAPDTGAATYAPCDNFTEGEIKTALERENAPVPLRQIGRGELVAGACVGTKYADFVAAVRDGRVRVPRCWRVKYVPVGYSARTSDGGDVIAATRFDLVCVRKDCRTGALTEYTLRAFALSQGYTFQPFALKVAATERAKWHDCLVAGKSPALVWGEKSGGKGARVGAKVAAKLDSAADIEAAIAELNARKAALSATAK